MVTLPNNNIDNIRMQGTSSKKEFDIFFKKYYTLFLSFACRYHLGTEEARDIVQDVFIAFWEQHEHFTSIIAISISYSKKSTNRFL